MLNDNQISRVVNGFKQMETNFNLKINLKKCEILRIKEGDSKIK